MFSFEILLVNALIKEVLREEMRNKFYKNKLFEFNFINCKNLQIESKKKKKKELYLNKITN